MTAYGEEILGENQSGRWVAGRLFDDVNACDNRSWQGVHQADR